MLVIKLKLSLRKNLLTTSTFSKKAAKSSAINLLTLPTINLLQHALPTKILIKLPYITAAKQNQFININNNFIAKSTTLNKKTANLPYNNFIIVN